jgi:hypothetical protein
MFLRIKDVLWAEKCKAIAVAELRQLMTRNGPVDDVLFDSVLAEYEELNIWVTENNVLRLVDVD